MVEADINGILKKISTFEFVVSMVVWYEVLAKANIVSKFLQKENMNIDEGVTQVQGLKEWMKLYRQQGFEKDLEITFKITKSCSLDVAIKSKFKPIRRKRHADETALAILGHWILKLNLKESFLMLCWTRLYLLFGNVLNKWINIKYRRNFGFSLDIANISSETCELQIEEKCLKVAEILRGDIDSNTLLVEIENIR